MKVACCPSIIRTPVATNKATTIAKVSSIKVNPRASADCERVFIGSTAANHGSGLHILPIAEFIVQQTLKPPDFHLGGIGFGRSNPVR